MKYGVRNSLLVAPMPTASTAQILGNNECFEPFTSNIYTRRTLAGEFIIVNKYLIFMNAGDTFCFFCSSLFFCSPLLHPATRKIIKTIVDI
jgi:hypothetical protein